MADREWKIAVGVFLFRLQNEKMTRHGEHRLQDARIANVAAPQLLIHHAEALGAAIS